jgi:hypothetical protein
MSDIGRLGKNSLFKPASEQSIDIPPKVGKQDLLNKQVCVAINPLESKHTSSAGLKKGWTRGAFVMREQTLENIRNYAYWERRSIKDVVEEAFDLFFQSREVSPRPDNQ